MAYEDTHECSQDAYLINVDGDDVDDTKTDFLGGEEPGAGDLSIFSLVKSAAGNLLSQVVRIAFGSNPTDVPSEEGNTDGMRWISLRAPLFLGGWGLDTEGNHVLGATKEEIDQGKLTRENFKYGPVDLRWDNDRNLWVAGGGASVKFLEFVDSEESE